LLVPDRTIEANASSCGGQAELTSVSTSTSAKLAKNVSFDIKPYLPYVTGAAAAAATADSVVAPANDDDDDDDAGGWPSDSARDNVRESWDVESNVEAAARPEEGAAVTVAAAAAATRSSSNPESEVRSGLPDGCTPSLERRRFWELLLDDLLTATAVLPSVEEDVVVLAMVRLRGGLVDATSLRVLLLLLLLSFRSFRALLRGLCSCIGSGGVMGYCC